MLCKVDNEYCHGSIQLNHFPTSSRASKQKETEPPFSLLGFFLGQKWRTGLEHDGSELSGFFNFLQLSVYSTVAPEWLSFVIWMLREVWVVFCKSCVCAGARILAHEKYLSLQSYPLSHNQNQPLPIQRSETTHWNLGEQCLLSMKSGSMKSAENLLRNIGLGFPARRD